MNILEFVQKQPFDWLGRTEAGSAILLVTKDDYESLRTLAARLAEAERDAKRYRWLVNCNDGNVWDFLAGMDDDQIDEEIDKWIAEDAATASTVEDAK